MRNFKNSYGDEMRKMSADCFETFFPCLFRKIDHTKILYLYGNNDIQIYIGKLERGCFMPQENITFYDLERIEEKIFIDTNNLLSDSSEIIDAVYEILENTKK